MDSFDEDRCKIWMSSNARTQFYLGFAEKVLRLNEYAIPYY